MSPVVNLSNPSKKFSTPPLLSSISEEKSITSSPPPRKLLLPSKEHRLTKVRSSFWYLSYYILCSECFGVMNSSSFLNPTFKCSFCTQLYLRLGFFNFSQHFQLKNHDFFFLMNFRPILHRLCCLVSEKKNQWPHRHCRRSQCLGMKSMIQK